MIKKSNQKLKINNNETIAKNNLNKMKCKNSNVGVAYHATRNAITLIALVITIIVLLILAGVTINLVLGPEGLLRQTQDATDKYKQAENEELNSMSNILAQLESINNGNGGETEPENPDNPEKPIDPQPGEPGYIEKVENNIKYTSDGEGNVIPVPEGFTYLEGTKEIGFVIRNDKDLNEFVWIPTDLVEYRIYDWNLGEDEGEIKYNKPTSYEETYGPGWNNEENHSKVNEVTKSVNDYKGYYISRYEAGVAEKRESKTEIMQEELPAPIFRATSSTMQIYAYNCVSWNDAIYIGDNLYNKENNNVTSRLINSRGWDTALKFIETVGENKDTTYPTDSTGKGWYNDNKSNNINYEIGKSTDLMNTTVPNRLKNVYDMGGNLFEWTADIYTLNTIYHAIRRRSIIIFRIRTTSSLSY